MVERSEMKAPTVNFAFWLAFCGISSYGVIYYLLRTDATSIVASSLALGAAIMVAITWAPTTYQAVRNGSREGRDLLRLGIWLIAVGVTLSRIFAVTYVFLERPHWLLYTPFNSLGAWTCIWGLGIILLAPGTSEGDVPHMNIYMIITALVIGVGIAAFTLGFFLGQATPGI